MNMTMIFPILYEVARVTLGITVTAYYVITGHPEPVPHTGDDSVILSFFRGLRTSKRTLILTFMVALYDR